MDPSTITPTDALTDPTAALAPMARLRELLEAGGPVVLILLAMSLLAATVIVFKLLQFHSARLGRTGVARRALAMHRGGDTAGALRIAESSPNPVAQVMVVALRGRRRGDLTEAAVREEVLRVGSDLLESLRGHFRTLELIGSLAPLLGLFGTVLGMISAFQQLQAAGNQVNPAVLSGGIWEALLTTAVGLAVAMPVVAVLTWLERRVDRLAHEMDNLVTQVFTPDLSSDNPAEANDHARLRYAKPPVFATGR